ncbi:MAG: hypothetical protein KAV87_41160 [Desulfobacteraceae bacterium]|nr:hypothetical protein [Desulfobacteraceae bacterium]
MSKLIIQQSELDKIEAVRLELHEIAKHNPQVEQSILSLTSKLWPIVYRKRNKGEDSAEPREDPGRPVKPHRSGGGFPLDPYL